MANKSSIFTNSTIDIFPFVTAIILLIGYMNSFVYSIQTHQIKSFSDQSHFTANKWSRCGKQTGICLYNKCKGADFVTWLSGAEWFFCTYVRVYIWWVILYLTCRQLRFSPYSGAVTTKVLTMVVFLYYPLSLALWSILCLIPLAQSAAVLTGVSLGQLLILMCSPFRSSACPRIWAFTVSFI